MSERCIIQHSIRELARIRHSEREIGQYNREKRVSFAGNNNVRAESLHLNKWATQLEGLKNPDEFKVNSKNLQF